MNDAGNHARPVAGAGMRGEICRVSSEGGRVRLAWGDGHESRFHAIWLRYNCDCEGCGTTTTGIRPLRLTHIPPDIAVEATAVDDHGRLALDWPDGHRTVFDAAWLRAHCYTAAEREGRRFKPMLWGPEIANHPPRSDYDAVRRDESALLGMLEKIRDYGFVWLRGVPVDVDETAKVAGLLGVMRISSYGAIYDFISQPEPRVYGDTGNKLEPHTDEAYRYWPPAITFFHLIKPSDDGGGHSILVDSFRVAEMLRERDPDGFDLLSHAPLNFHRDVRDGEREFRCAARVFSLDFEGNVSGFRLLDRGAGPLDLPEDMIEPYFAALRGLLEITYDEDEQLVLPLEVGDVLIFNNQRVMHGRTAFDRGEGGRHLRTCSVDLDEFHARLRMLSRRLGSDSLDVAMPVGPVA